MCSLKHQYPKKYNLCDLDISSFKSDTQMWKVSRGFIPSMPLSYVDEFETDHLVVPMYDKDNELLAYQLRDINDTETETKYKITKPIYEAYVKTDNRDISGRMVICEGTMDCVLLREHGINAWTTLGLKKFKILRLIEELEGVRFIYVLDNDQPGKYFAKRYFSKTGIGWEIPTVFKDINELFKIDKTTFFKYLQSLKKIVII